MLKVTIYGRTTAFSGRKWAGHMRMDREKFKHIVNLWGNMYKEPKMRLFSSCGHQVVTLSSLFIIPFSRLWMTLYYTEHRYCLAHDPDMSHSFMESTLTAEKRVEGENSG